MLFQKLEKTVHVGSFDDLTETDAFDVRRGDHDQGGIGMDAEHVELFRDTVDGPACDFFDNANAMVRIHHFFPYAKFHIASMKTVLYPKGVVRVKDWYDIGCFNRFGGMAEARG